MGPGVQLNVKVVIEFSRQIEFPWLGSTHTYSTHLPSVPRMKAILTLLQQCKKESKTSLASRNQGIFSTIKEDLFKLQDVLKYNVLLLFYLQEKYCSSMYLYICACLHVWSEISKDCGSQSIFSLYVQISYGAETSQCLPGMPLQLFFTESNRL